MSHFSVLVVGPDVAECCLNTLARLALDKIDAQAVTGAQPEEGGEGWLTNS